MERSVHRVVPSLAAGKEGLSSFKTLLWKHLSHSFTISHHAHKEVTLPGVLIILPASGP